MAVWTSRTQAQTTFVCPTLALGEDYHFLNPDNCAAFYKCTADVGGTLKAVRQDCSSGLLFNPTINVCDWPYNVDCGRT